MSTLSLGNVSVVEVVKTEGRGGRVTVTRVDRSDLGPQETTVSFPDGMPVAEQLAAVESSWPLHSDSPPAWVDSEDGLLAELVARRYSVDGHVCRVGRPKTKKGD